MDELDILVTRLQKIQHIIDCTIQICLGDEERCGYPIVKNCIRRGHEHYVDVHISSVVKIERSSTYNLIRIFFDGDDYIICPHEAYELLNKYEFQEQLELFK